ncbi:hypothetical protein [Pseudomonas sp. 273]|uniref:hypothetical protein n=1 Tax=Pseudomonas sp. 273 TaxID=75692 RepID=UPI0023D8857E|nr:hypothetical protein [Pseudomonas sp. 273]
MTTADEVFQKIKSDNFLHEIFSQNTNWESMLDARDSSEFDTLWSAAYKIIQEDGRPETLKAKEAREISFKRIFQLTGNSELAGYASDDLGLVIDALEKKLDIDFINKLWGIYTSGGFPH